MAPIIHVSAEVEMVKEVEETNIIEN